MRTVLSVVATTCLVAACTSGGAAEPSPSTRRSTPAPTSSSPTPITAFDPDKSVVVRTVAATPGSAPSGITVGAGAVWVTEHRAGAVARLDPRTGKFVAQIKLPNGIGNVEDAAVVRGRNVLLCIYGGANLLYRISARTNKITGRLHVPCNGQGRAGAHDMWVSSGAKLDLVDPGALKVLRTLTVDGTPSDVGVDITEAGGSVWLFYGDGTLLRVDPANGHVQKAFHLGGGAGLATTDGKRMYSVDPTTHTMHVIDVASNRVVGSVHVPGDDAGDPQLTYALGSLWLSTLNGGLARMNPKTFKITGSVQLDTQDYIGEVGVGFGHVWYPGYGSDNVFEVRLLGR